MQEHVEQRRFETLAREAEAAYGRRDLSPEQRRVMAFFAVQGLRGMWEVARRPAGLCQARNLLRRVEREIGFANDRALAERLSQATETALQETGLRNPCGPAKPTPGQKTPLAAAPMLPPAPAATPPVEAVPQDMDPEPGAPPLLASSTPRRPTSTGLGAPKAETGAAIAAHDRRRGPLSTGQIIGGSLLLAAGTAGWVGVGLLLGKANAIDREVEALNREVIAQGTDATATQLTKYELFVELHERNTAVAGVVGTAAGLATLGGVLLLAIRPRASRTIARPWASRWSAGVTLTGNF